MIEKNFSLSRTQAARILLGVFFVCLIAAILASLCLSLVSYSTVLNMLNQYAADGAATFSQDNFSAIIARIRLLAVGLLITAPVALILRALILEYIGTVLASAKFFFTDIKSGFSAIASETMPHILCLCSIFVVGLILRICLITQPIRFDEANTFINYASKPLVFGLTMYSAPNNHLLNTFFMHLCHALFGSSLWALRLPAFCAGLLLTASFYCWARVFAGRQAALLLAGLLATSPVLIEYSTNARGYMLETFFFGLLLLLMHYVKRTNNALAWLLLSLCAALGFYTVPVMVYPFCMISGAFAVWFFGKRTDANRNEFLKRFGLFFFLTIGITIVLYLPVVIVSGVEPLTGSSVWQPKGSFWLLNHAPQYISTIWLYWNKGLPDSIIIFLAVGFIFTFGSLTRFWATLLLVFGVVGIIAFIRVPPVPAFNRVWIFAAPLYYAAAACGLAQISSMLLSRLPLRKRDGFIALLCISITLATGIKVFKDGNKCFEGETGGFRDAENAARFLKTQLRTNDKIVCQCPSGQPLQYYFIRQNTPLHYYSTDMKKYRRLIIIVNTFSSQTLDGVLLAEGVSAEEFGAAKLLARYDTGLIYQMQPK